MCVSQSMIKNILIMIYDDSHVEFDRISDRIINSYYIRDFFKHLTDYLKHCFQCRVNRIRGHKFYDNLQFVLSSSIFFHSIIIDFVLILSKFHIDMNNIKSIIDKLSKRITIISSKNIYNATLWVKALLNRLNLIDWNFSKIIISNKNRKFLLKLWSVFFLQFDGKLLYFTIYHSQIYNSFKRIN